MTSRKYTSKAISYIPCQRVKTKNVMNFSKKINKYTPEGRKLIHKSIDKVSDFEFTYLVKNPIINRSIEL